MLHNISKNTARIASIFAGATIVASGFMGAAPAQAAAPADVWDRVAECESGGRWNISTGNGYHGGLQFSQSSWQAAGGKGSPAGASKAEQKRVAQNLLRMQGPGAWPVCSKKAGLTKTNGMNASTAEAPTRSKSSTARSVAPNRATTKRSGSTTAVRTGSITALQKALGVTADGVVGPATRVAANTFLSKNADKFHPTTKAVQRAVGASTDGIVGPQTRALVNSTLG